VGLGELLTHGAPILRRGKSEGRREPALWMLLGV
jgi:hypothetical protein